MGNMSLNQAFPPVLLSNNQARPGSNFSQPRDLLVKLAKLIWLANLLAIDLKVSQWRQTIGQDFTKTKKEAFI